MGALASSAVVGGLRGDEGGRYGSADGGLYLIRTQRRCKPFQIRLLVLKISWDFWPPPLFQQHCHAHRQLRRCARQTRTLRQSAEDSTKASAAAIIITFLQRTRCRPHPSAMQGGVPDDPTTMSSSGSNLNPRSSTRTRAEATLPFMSRAGAGRWGRHGGCVLGLKWTDSGGGEGGKVTAVPHHYTPLTLTKFELTVAGPQHPSTRQSRRKPLSRTPQKETTG